MFHCSLPTTWCLYKNLLWCQTISISLATFPSHRMSESTTWLLSGTQNCTRCSPHQTFKIASKWGRPTFANTDLIKTSNRSLYLANNQRRWKFSIGHTQEKIFNLDSSTYVVYSLGTISTNYVCPKAKTIVKVQVKSSQAVKLNPRCYIRTMDQVIMVDETEDMELHSKWLDWTWSLGEPFQQPRTRSLQKPSRSYSPRSPANSMLTIFYAKSTPWPRRSIRFTGPSHHQESWSRVPWSSYSSDYAAGRSAVRQTNQQPTPPATLILNQHLDLILRWTQEKKTFKSLP